MLSWSILSAAEGCRAMLRWMEAAQSCLWSGVVVKGLLSAQCELQWLY